MRARVLAIVGMGLTTAGCGASAPPAEPGFTSTGARARPAEAPAAPLDAGAPAPTSGPPTFAEDLAFLREHGAVHVLEAPSGARVALSAKYQGRVMTSAVAADGRSCGWIHRAFIASGKTGTAFDNFGGEDRLWLGPEGGQFGLYFPRGAPFTFDAWQVPHAMQEGAWDMPEATPTRATFTRTMHVENWSGTPFDVAVERTVELLDGPRVKQVLGIDVASAPGVRWVAFESRNQITNVGKAAWRRETGLVSVWILAMYAPAPDGKAILPFVGGTAGPVVNDGYFGKVPPERLSVRPQEGVVLFTVDGKLRSKIGLAPGRAKPVLGSYSAEAELLTIVSYDLPVAKPGQRLPYVNSTWEKQKDPYAGDVVNSYNDGPTGEGKPALGGFYELETSSPGAALAPKQSLVHTHRTLHVVGDRAALEGIAKAALGVSLAALDAKQ